MTCHGLGPEKEGKDCAGQGRAQLPFRCAVWKQQSSRLLVLGENCGRRGSLGKVDGGARSLLTELGFVPFCSSQGAVFIRSDQHWVLTGRNMQRPHPGGLILLGSFLSCEGRGLLNDLQRSFSPGR